MSKESDRLGGDPGLPGISLPLPNSNCVTHGAIRLSCLESKIGMVSLLAQGVLNIERSSVDA